MQELTQSIKAKSDIEFEYSRVIMFRTKQSNREIHIVFADKEEKIHSVRFVEGKDESLDIIEHKYQE